MTLFDILDIMAFKKDDKGFSMRQGLSKFLVVMIVIVSAMSAGCTSHGSFLPSYSSGTKVSSDTLAQIQAGDSMEAVKALIGESTSTIHSTKGEVWTYEYCMVTFAGPNVREVTVVVFDLNKKVSRAYRADDAEASVLM